MKKILAIAIASIMIGSSAMGLADVNGADKMSVVNCSAWVSLRSEPKLMPNAMRIKRVK